MILLSVAALSVIILLTFVVPQFQRLFADAGRALPLATQIVIAIGDGFRHYWWVGFIVIGLIVAVVRQQLNRPESRLRWDRGLLRLPLLGGLISRVETARLVRTLGTLLGNGVSLLSALTIVRETLSNQGWRRRWARWRSTSKRAGGWLIRRKRRSFPNWRCR